MKDASLLYRWRNDSESVANSFGSKPVRWPEHLRWLSRRLKSIDPIYIFEFHDHPVGTVNIDGDILSYTIAPESRGHGLGTLMLALVKDRHGPLKCQVKPDNVKSIKAATKAGHLVILDH